MSLKYGLVRLLSLATECLPSADANSCAERRTQSSARKAMVRVSRNFAQIWLLDMKKMILTYSMEQSPS